MKSAFLTIISCFLVLFTTCRDIDSILPNRDPVAVAVADIASNAIYIGVPVPLDGSGSTDPDGDRLSYEWKWITRPAQSNAIIIPFDSVKVTFIPDLPGDYSISLRVSDNIRTASDTVHVTVVQSNGAPVAHAGADDKVHTGDTFNLKGSGTDPDNDPITYLWQMVSKPVGSTATIANPANPNTSFVADKDGVYIAALTVSDGTLSDRDSINVTTIVQGSPIANAGQDGNVLVGSTFALNGSGTDPDGDPITFSWVFSSKPAGSIAIIQNASAAVASFLADRAGAYVAVLTVSDGTLSDTDSVTITAGSTVNHPPIANAGVDGAVTVGNSFALSGSATDADGDQLTYAWLFLTRPSGSTATILNSNSASASFTADKAGAYLATLTVSDGELSDTDSINIIASAVNHPPVADAGSDNKGDLGQVVPLTGSGSDPDGNPITYSWTLTSKPVGSTATIQNPTSAAAAITPDRHGSYTATLTVSDGSLNGSDQVIITTNPVDITGINPTMGPYGITVKISGINFSSVLAENKFKFNGVDAVVSVASYTSLDVVVPKGAGTGNVSVTVNNVTDIGPVFTYILSGVVSTLSQFDAPYAMTTDAAGNIFIADYKSNLIRKLTSTGTLTTLAGIGQGGYLDGKTTDAIFNHPSGIAYDGQNNFLYVSDNGNHCIRKIDLNSMVVSTLAGFPQAGYNNGPGGQAQFNSPIGLGIDSFGNLYVGDSQNSRIRKVTPAGVVSTFAGNGQVGFADGNGTVAQFNAIGGVTVNPTNNNVFVADAFNNRIRRIDQNTTVSTLAGTATAGLLDGAGTIAQFKTPFGVGCDAAGNVYVADANNHSIRKVTPQGVVTTIAGNGTSGYVEGPGASARFSSPVGVTVSSDGKVYVADYVNQRVRLVLFE